jgi:hypothetical protein
LDMGHVPWDRRERFYHRVTGQYRNLRDQVNWDLLRNAPTNRGPARLQQFQRQ